MSVVSLSAENERFLQSKVDAGCFPSLNDAINALIEEQRGWDDIVRQKVADGLADLEAGRYTEYDDASLKAYFQELVSETSEKAAAKICEK